MENTRSGEKLPPMGGLAEAVGREEAGLPSGMGLQGPATDPDPSGKLLCQETPSCQDISGPHPDPPEKPLCQDGPQVVVPERGCRRMALVVLLGFLLATAAVLGAFGYELGRLHRLEGEELRQTIVRLQRWAAGMACLGAVGFLGAAWWMFRLGWKINRTGRYPPPGMQVLWKTRIRTGPTALLWANYALLLAVLLAAAGTVGTIWFYQQAVEALRNLLPGR